MKYQYEQIFAKEYVGYKAISDGMEEAFRLLQGRLLTGWRSNARRGIHYLEFGSHSLILWYQNPNHCKIKFGTQGLPGLQEDLLPLSGEKEYQNRALQDCYVLMGEEPKICLSLQDSFFNPEEDSSLQYILASGKANTSVQVARVSGVGPYRTLSVDRIPTTKLYRKTVQHRETGEQQVSILDEEGGTLIPPIYNDVDFVSGDPVLFRTGLLKAIPGGESYFLYGICDISGREVIPCTYPDLYYMANGFYLVMDYRHKWWVLNEQNEAIFGPHSAGVDIYSHNRDYLYYIEYNPVAQCEALGIYSISLRTILTPAEFIRIRYAGNDTFDVQKIYGPGDIRCVRIDAYGVVQS